MADGYRWSMPEWVPSKRWERDPGRVDAHLRQGTPHRLGAEVEVEVVAAAGVEVDRPQAAERVGVVGHHPHRVPGQPPRPHLVDQPAGGGVERDLTVPSSSAEKHAATP